LVDYRIGVEEMKKAVHEKLGGLPCHNAFDTISANGTWIPISHMLSPSGSNTPSYLSVVSGSQKYDDDEINKNVEIVYTFCGTAHTGKYRPGAPNTPTDRDYQSDPEWAFVFFKYISRMLADGRLTGHPFEVLDGGLEGVGKGLTMLKEGKAKGVKYVFRVGNE
jgi:NADPH2:quinone reductase